MTAVISSRSLQVAPMLSGIKFSFSLQLACRNLCERLDTKATSGEMNYKDEKKYCRRCEIFLFNFGNFCPCCGMALRKSPTGRVQREKLRTSKLLLSADQNKQLEIAQA
jgi:predicted amidophosphoribosyltransferase